LYIWEAYLITRNFRDFLPTKQPDFVFNTAPIDVREHGEKF